MSQSTIIPLLLLILLVLALGLGAIAVVFVLSHARRRRQQLDASSPRSLSHEPLLRPSLLSRPSSWLAIKGRSIVRVQAALGLLNPKPCSFIDGLLTNEKLFIAPPVNGWILVLGTGLPDPSEDVDICFHFLLNLSRKLGEVQFFNASPVLHEHAWVRAERGRIIRAYAWAGKTLWLQGRRTPAERQLGLKCFAYLDDSQHKGFSGQDVIVANVEKVPLLAARWSLDPACIDERLLEQQCGIAGEPSRRY